MYTDGSGESSVDVTPVCGGVAILPVSRSLGGLLGFERNGEGKRSLEMISTTQRNGRVPESSLNRLLILI